MNFDLKSLTCEVASRMGLPLIQKKFFRDYITIVMYHGVTRTPLGFYDWCFIEEEEFRKQIKYLKKHFEIIPLSGIGKRVKTHKPDKPVLAITFDDGYQNNYDVAFPILREEKVPATIFLATGFIDTDETIWSFKLHHALTQTSKSSFNWDGCDFQVGEAAEKVAVLRLLRTKLKNFPQNKLLPMVREIILKLDVDPDEGLDKNSPYRILGREAIKTMQASGLMEFGAHTSSHSILGRLTPEEQEKEIRSSVETVRKITGKACRLFAYPNGEAGDYDAKTVEILIGCGIETAVTTINGYNDSNSSLMELKRYGVGANLPLSNFKVMVHHLNSLARRVLGERRMEVHGN